MPIPTNQQIERHIRRSAGDSANVALSKHAKVRMRQRGINYSMVLDVLRLGRLALAPEPDMKHSGLLCRMQRFVAGMQVAVVAYVEYPAPDLTVVTVIDITRD